MDHANVELKQSCWPKGVPGCPRGFWADGDWSAEKQDLIVADVGAVRGLVDRSREA